MKALVYRRRGPVWEFTPHAIYHRLIHITRNGTIYGIFLDDAGIKPVWIGRRVDGKWITWEAEIGAMIIRWSNGGEYYFPENKRRSI